MSEYLGHYCYFCQKDKLFIKSRFTDDDISSRCINCGHSLGESKRFEDLKRYDDIRKDLSEFLSLIKWDSGEVQKIIEVNTEIKISMIAIVCCIAFIIASALFTYWYILPTLFCAALIRKSKLDYTLCITQLKELLGEKNVITASEFVHTTIYRDIHSYRRIIEIAGAIPMMETVISILNKYYRENLESKKD